MTRSPFRRLAFGALRRLLYLWVRSETINQSAFTLKLDRSKPVLYVLQQPSASDLAVVDRECTKAGLPRPVLPVAVGELLEPTAFFYLTPEPGWLGGPGEHPNQVLGSLVQADAVEAVIRQRCAHCEERILR